MTRRNERVEFRECIICGFWVVSNLVGYRRGLVYCPSCRDVLTRKKNALIWDKNRPKYYAAMAIKAKEKWAAIKASAKPKLIKCGICGKIIIQNSGNHKYCNDCKTESRRRNSKNWRTKNPKQYRALNRKRRLEDPESERKRSRVYCHQNLDKYRIYAHNRRARIEGNGGTHTIQELNNLFKEQDDLCYYCGTSIFRNVRKSYHIDHKLPLSRGGSNDIHNIVLTCPACNWKKRTLTDIEFLSLYEKNEEDTNSGTKVGSTNQ